MTKTADQLAKLAAHTRQVKIDLAAAKARYKDTSLTVRRLKSDLRDAEYRERKAAEVDLLARRAARVAS